MQLSSVNMFIYEIVPTKLSQYVSTNDLQEPFQSAYTANHSTETALGKVHNDLMHGVDKDGAAMLVLLDLSAAFDTISHSIMVNRLKDYGVSDAALLWFSSYLSKRTQKVSIHNTFSNNKVLCYGVPQGSVLGPLLFNIYVSPLGKIISKYGIKYHLYADDIQLYASFNPKLVSSKVHCIENMENCIKNIKNWMELNHLRINDQKTEVMVTSTDYFLRSGLASSVTLRFGSCYIQSKEFVKNLGVTFDSRLDLTSQIDDICKSTAFQLHNIWRIRKYLDKPTTEKIVHSLVTSRVDYCNSLFHSASKTALAKLQRIQNMAARVVETVSKYDHISPVLSSLHWLPIHHRISFKILLLVYKALHNLAPSYLSDLFVFYSPSRVLRSAGKCYLKCLNFRLKTFGFRSLEVYGPNLWNSLPLELRLSPSRGVFKSNLKTYLFESNTILH